MDVLVYVLVGMNVAKACGELNRYVYNEKAVVSYETGEIIV